MEYIHFIISRSLFIFSRDLRKYIQMMNLLARKLLLLLYMFVSLRVPGALELICITVIWNKKPIVTVGVYSKIFCL